MCRRCCASPFWFLRSPNFYCMQNVCIKVHGLIGQLWHDMTRHDSYSSLHNIIRKSQTKGVKMLKVFYSGVASVTSKKFSTLETHVLHMLMFVCTDGFALCVNCQCGTYFLWMKTHTAKRTKNQQNWNFMTRNIIRHNGNVFKMKKNQQHHSSPVSNCSKDFPLLLHRLWSFFFLRINRQWNWNTLSSYFPNDMLSHFPVFKLSLPKWSLDHSSFFIELSQKRKKKLHREKLQSKFGRSICRSRNQSSHKSCDRITAITRNEPPTKIDNMSKLETPILIIIFIAFNWCLPLACPSHHIDGIFTCNRQQSSCLSEWHAFVKHDMIFFYGRFSNSMIACVFSCLFFFFFFSLGSLESISN